MHIRQAKLPTLISVRQSFMVNTAELQDRGLHIVDMNGVFRDVPAELIRSAMDISGLDAASSEPPTECLAEMVSPGWFVGIPLSKFCCPIVRALADKDEVTVDFTKWTTMRCRFSTPSGSRASITNAVAFIQRKPPM